MTQAAYLRFAKKLVGFGGAWGIALFFSVPAEAFCRSNTCQANGSCETGHVCAIGGAPLRWNRACISFSVQRNVPFSTGMTLDQAETVVSKAFQTWMDAPCSSGKTPTIGAVNLGEVLCDKVEFNSCSGNANAWLFRIGEWTHSDSVHTYGLTTVQFNKNTGEMQGADVELNVPRILVDGISFDKVITHEAGHFFGLDHSALADATMAPSPGKRDISVLAQDDIDGICALYPPDEAVGTCDPTPLHGFSKECGSGTCASDQGCSASASKELSQLPRGAWGGLVMALAVLSARLVTRRRRGSEG